MTKNNMSLDVSCTDTTGVKLIDESHPDVAALVGAGYTTEESISAMEKCGTRKDALEYLEMLEAGDDEENEVNSTANQHQLAREISLEKFQDWLSYPSTTTIF